MMSLRGGSNFAVHGGVGVDTVVAAKPPAVVAKQLCEVLLNFPQAAIGGVRWSVLVRKYEERSGMRLAATLGPEQSPLVAATTLLWEVLRLVDANAPDGPLVAVEDAVALTPRPGAFGSWPSLYATLCQVVRKHGALMRQPAAEVKAGPGQEPHDQQNPHQPQPEEDPGKRYAHGLLLSRLKPLLQSNWHRSFEEHGLGFLDRDGSHMRLKKMKHLLTAILRWRLERQAWRKASGRSWTAVDEALAFPLALVTPEGHNDLMLCCPAHLLTEATAAAPVSLCAAARALAPEHPGRPPQEDEEDLELRGGAVGLPQQPARKEQGCLGDQQQGPLSAQQLSHRLEEENTRLRAENQILRQQGRPIQQREQPPEQQQQQISYGPMIPQQPSGPILQPPREQPFTEAVCYGVPTTLCFVKPEELHQQLQQQQQQQQFPHKEEQPQQEHEIFDNPFEPPPEKPSRHKEALWISLASTPGAASSLSTSFPSSMQSSGCTTPMSTGSGVLLSSEGRNRDCKWPSRLGRTKWADLEDSDDEEGTEPSSPSMQRQQQPGSSAYPSFMPVFFPTTQQLCDLVAIPRGIVDKHRAQFDQQAAPLNHVPIPGPLWALTSGVNWN